MMSSSAKTKVTSGMSRATTVVCGVVALLICTSINVTRAKESTRVAESVERAGVIRAAVDRMAPSLVRIETIGGIAPNRRTTSGDSTSTGVIVSNDGYIIVSSHALRHKPRSILVRLDDGTRHAATVVAKDRTRGLTLVKIDVEEMLTEPVTVATDELRVGQTAIAVGRAIDEQEPNVSVGIISALSRAGGRAIQTDANTSRNHYGGALIDLHGRLIGIVVPVGPLAGSMVAKLDLYDSGIGFAIPAAQVYDALGRLKEGVDLLPGRLGVSLETAATIDAPAVVALCRPNSDAYRQGVRTGDRIVAIAGQSIDRHAQIGDQLAPRYAGDHVAVTLRRGDETIEANIELLAEIATYEPAVIGILPARTTQPTNVEDADDKVSSGVVVRQILADSPASNADIVPGDRITAVADTAVADATELRAQLEEHRVGDTLTLTLNRDNEQLDVDITLGAITKPLGAGDEIDTATDVDAAAAAPFPDVQLLEIPKIDQQAVVFSPGDDDERGQCGLMIWISDSEAADLQESIAGWREICTRQRWTLVAVTIPGGPLDPASPDRLAGTIEFCRDHFGTSSDRTVLVAQGTSALVAWQTAISRADLCRGVMVIEPTQIGPIREMAPGRTFEVFMTNAADARTAQRADAVTQQLRQWKYAVTVTTTAEPLAALPVTPTKEMIRWLDGVDRL